MQILSARVAGHRFLFALVCLLAAFAAVVPAHDARAQVVPSVLEEVRVITSDDDSAEYLLRFTPGEPRIAEINTNPTAPEVVMATTLKVGRIRARETYRGFVRATTFATEGSSLVMRFDTAGPATVTAQRMGAGAVQVRVARVGREEAIGTRPIGSEGEEVVPQQELNRGPVDSWQPGDSYELVMLRYADVSEVIGLLVEGVEIQPNDVFIREAPGFGSVGTNQNNTSYIGAPQQAQRESLPLGQNFGNGLAIDRRLNAIWVTGSPERIEQVKRQIELIDVPVDSVILETQFVELTETGARNLGLDFTNQNGQIAVGSVSTGGFNPFGVDPTDILPSAQLQIAIAAQIQRGEGRIVSRPRIAAQSGSTARIITGDALPILTSIQLSGVNGVSQQVQYVNVGVTLQIAPRVSSDGYITSRIYGVVSSVTGFSQGYPTISQREAETSASVRDGETFVIGGLTQDNVLTTRSRIPLLGDIPLVGYLFQNERSTTTRTELYIVITPRIVRHRRFEDAERAAQERELEAAGPAYTPAGME
ncbi:type II secretion system protein GspD [Aurantiacibacter luteus]|uniref:type II secretion system protein GspD n=1 Tax=Aurantiacibacter luteus TaxID=1581420 RepID=UPI00069CB4F0|nr:secretin N-terminal domain-containing protein [Aurantiacibacter luteus]